MKRRTIQLSPWGAVSVAFLAVYLCLATVVKFNAPFSVDRVARDFFLGIQGITAGSVIRGWAIFGDWQVLTVMLILVSFALSRGIKRDFLLFFLLALGGGGALGQLSKVVVGRLRPGDPRFAFPSGHTLAAMVTVIGLLYFAYRGRLLRRPLGVAGSAAGGVFIVLGVGISRMYTDSHWLSDVVGGVLLGGAVATGTALALELRQVVHSSEFVVQRQTAMSTESRTTNPEPSPMNPQASTLHTEP